jgi:hypothetical protein
MAAVIEQHYDDGKVVLPKVLADRLQQDYIEV